MSRLVLVLFVAIYIAGVNPARILGVYPMPSISHQVVFRALTLELIKRGHELVVITPDPMYKDNESPALLTEIDISDAYKTLLTMFMDISQHMKRGVIIDAVTMTQNNINSTSYLLHHIFDFPEVNKLIEDKDQKFDLVIVEALADSSLIFSKIFNAPVALISSLYGMPTNYETIGAVSRHPLLFPNVMRTKFKYLGILDKIAVLYEELNIWRFEQEGEKQDNEFLKSRFGIDAPTTAELKKNVVLLLVNAHPILEGNRPVPPGIVYVGAMHLQPKKELPPDLKSYLDNSTRGVVYVSLGTNCKPSLMEKDFFEAFLDAFEQIPYDILWKYDGDKLERLPKNVRTQKWFPQRDLLHHPNIKLFVMQGGLQSTDEAIDAEVPMVGIPILGDQWYNTNKHVELGIGVQLDSYTMTAEDLVKAVDTVATDPTYKENIKNLKSIMQDQPEKSIDRAVWWIEHVLRHKGSRHLLGAAAQVSWSKYLMLDVFIALAIVFSILVFIVVTALYYMLRLIFKINNTVKIKKS